VKNAFDVRYQDWANAAGNLLRTKMDNIGRTYGVTAGIKF
jgi:outer membrane receptor protein involved in Fe transport